jgi:predicted TIM-barrel fold metal-dependent hydrolase
MIFTGVFERFPQLRFVVAEVNCGWMPFWLENMDQNFHQQRHWSQLPIDRPPSSYAGENVFVTTLDDHVGFDAMRENILMADAVMYSTDYPHSVSLWPNSRKHIADLTIGMDDAIREKILSGNAERIYRFSSRD